MNHRDYDKEIFNTLEKFRERSNCRRRKVAAALVTTDREFIQYAVNDISEHDGVMECVKDGCLREALDVPSGRNHELCHTIHAEQKAIIKLLEKGYSAQDATLYITHSPCSMCVKFIILTGIKRVVYRDEYPDSIDKLEIAGIKCEKFIGGVNE